jgi:small subunit ribosomal protein S6
MSRSTTAPNRAREYETIYILRPDVDADTADNLGTRIAEVVTGNKGRLTKVELWGRRRLAFEIGKQRRGVYVYLKYLGGGSIVSEIERNLNLLKKSGDVLRFQTVLVGNDIEVAAAEIAEEDVKFERLELPPLEEDREDSRERQLGLIEPERRERHADIMVAEGVEDGDVEPGAEGAADEEEA